MINGGFGTGVLFIFRTKQRGLDGFEYHNRWLFILSWDGFAFLFVVRFIIISQNFNVYWIWFYLLCLVITGVWVGGFWGGADTK